MRPPTTFPNPTPDGPADVLVVLGGGVEHDGTLPPLAEARIAIAADRYHGGMAPRLVLSGRCSLTMTDPPVTEAAAMAAYARALGVPARALFCEDRSQDTIGNAYFSRARYLAPNHWHRVRVVTTDFHGARAAWTFERILGPSFDVAVTAVPSGLAPEALAARRQEEAAVLLFIQEWFARIEQTDAAARDEAVEMLVHRDHGVYAAHPRMPVAAMLAELESVRRRLAAVAVPA